MTDRRQKAKTDSAALLSILALVVTLCIALASWGVSVERRVTVNHTQLEQIVPMVDEVRSDIKTLLGRTQP